MAQKISAIIIEPDSCPLPVLIENDILALNRAVNINWKGQPHPDFEAFEIVELKNNIHIISSPKGEERSLPLTRTVGKHCKFYGIMYIVKMDGYNLVSMTDNEVTEYCRKFLFDTISMESLGFKSVDADDDDDSSSYSGGRVEITFDDW